MKTRTQLAKGTHLEGRYIIEETIGYGGMGTVYRAIAIASNRRVAIKSLHPELSHSTSAVARFHQEARLCATIGHHAICQVVDMGITPGGMPFLVMPLLEGASLAYLIKKGGRVNMERLLDILVQTLSALSAAHAKGIVHRDLKPQNIFISKSDDDKDQVTLLDFGISKLVTQSVDSNLTASGAVLGTAHYMSPEQAKGERNIDFRVDIYSLGVIAFEMVTDRLPFSGDSYNEVMFKILTEPLPFPTALNPLVPAALERIILKAMSRELADRYPTAEAMLTEVESLRTGVAVGRTTRPTLAFTSERNQGGEEVVVHPSTKVSSKAKQSVPLKSKFFFKKPLIAVSLIGIFIIGALVAHQMLGSQERTFNGKATSRDGLASPHNGMVASHRISIEKGIRTGVAGILEVWKQQPLVKRLSVSVVENLNKPLILPALEARKKSNAESSTESSTESGAKSELKISSVKKKSVAKSKERFKKKPLSRRRLDSWEVVKGPSGTEFLFSTGVESDQ